MFSNLEALAARSRASCSLLVLLANASAACSSEARPDPGTPPLPGPSNAAGASAQQSPAGGGSFVAGGSTAGGSAGGGAATTGGDANHGGARADGSAGATSMGSPFVYVGSGFYDIPNPQLYVFRLDESTGALTEMQKTSVDASPSFIAITPDSRFLYLNIENTPTSAVAFQIEPGGLLKKLNSAENGSNGSAYISTDRSGRFVLQANYETGSAAVIATNSDGSLGDVVDEKDLGESAFPHSIVVDPTNQFAFVANRSGDYIAQFRFDAETGALEKNDAATVEAPPGTGPRHLVFHPQAPYAYVNNERNSTVTRYAYDAVAGTLTEKDQVSTVPAGQTGRNAPADMRIHPNGKFLYVANRGHYSIARFLVNAESGELTAAGHEIFEGEPRNLFIDPNGRFLVVGNMGLGNVLVYAIDAETGALTLRGTPTPVASPSGIAIAYSAAQ